jgi:hypothetical protein
MADPLRLAQVAPGQCGRLLLHNGIANGLPLGRRIDHPGSITLTLIRWGASSVAAVTGNLGTHAKRLVEKAGITVWPRFLGNLRGSCSDDLARRGVSDKAITAWIGNTGRIRQRHYHAVRPEDWAAAVAGIPAPSGAVSGHQEPSTLHGAREKSLDVQKALENKHPRQGFVDRGLV